MIIISHFSNVFSSTFFHVLKGYFENFHVFSCAFWEELRKRMCVLSGILTRTRQHCEIPRKINFDNQQIFFFDFFSKTAWISLKSLPKQPIATFYLKSRLPYNTTYGRATQAVSTHCYRPWF